MDYNVPQIQKATHGGGNSFPRSPGEPSCPTSQWPVCIPGPHPFSHGTFPVKSIKQKPIKVCGIISKWVFFLTRFIKIRTGALLEERDTGEGNHCQESTADDTEVRILLLQRNVYLTDYKVCFYYQFNSHLAPTAVSETRKEVGTVPHFFTTGSPRCHTQ